MLSIIACSVHILEFFGQLKDFWRVKRYLSTDVSVLVANALISSHLDNCNSLLGICQNSSYSAFKNSAFPVLLLVLKNYTGYMFSIVKFSKL